MDSWVEDVAVRLTIARVLLEKEKKRLWPEGEEPLTSPISTHSTTTLATPADSKSPVSSHLRAIPADDPVQSRGQSSDRRRLSKPPSDKEKRRLSDSAALFFRRDSATATAASADDRTTSPIDKQSPAKVGFLQQLLEGTRRKSYDSKKDNK